MPCASVSENQTRARAEYLNGGFRSVTRPSSSDIALMLERPVGHNEPMGQTIEAPVRAPEREVHEVREPDPPWIVIVWNDPVNLMSYVTLVFRKLFGYSEAKATELMLQVHHEGRPSSRAARARRPNTTSHACTPTGSGRRCGRTR